MLKWISDLKLSAHEWLLATGAAFIGVLLLLLRSKNKQLHTARVALLKQKHDTATAKHQIRVQEARKRYEKARERLDAVLPTSPDKPPS